MKSPLSWELTTIRGFLPCLDRGKTYLLLRRLGDCKGGRDDDGLSGVNTVRAGDFGHWQVIGVLIAGHDFQNKDILSTQETYTLYVWTKR